MLRALDIRIVNSGKVQGHGKLTKRQFRLSSQLQPRQMFRYIEDWQGMSSEIVVLNITAMYAR